MLLEFLKTKRTKKELNIALDILKEFKNCENLEEWVSCPFYLWTRLEQLEDYLGLLTNRETNKIKDKTAKKYYKKEIKCF